jgi:hypothetical protein
MTFSNRDRVTLLCLITGNLPPVNFVRSHFSSSVLQGASRVVPVSESKTYYKYDRNIPSPHISRVHRYGHRVSLINVF